MSKVTRGYGSAAASTWRTSGWSTRVARTGKTGGVAMDQNSPLVTPARPTVDDVWIPSVCRVCSNCCGIKVHRRNGVIVKIEGDPDNPHNFGKLLTQGGRFIRVVPSLVEDP